MRLDRQFQLAPLHRSQAARTKRLLIRWFVDVLRRRHRQPHILQFREIDRRQRVPLGPTVTRLNSITQRLIDIDGEPIEMTDDKKGWRCVFKLQSDS